MPLATPPCVKPPALYRPRDPQASDLWRVMDQHFETCQQIYDERFQTKYGFGRPIGPHSMAEFLTCRDLHEGIPRVSCPDCKHEMFVAYSCKQRCTCPSCHQKRTLLTVKVKGSSLLLALFLLLWHSPTLCPAPYESNFPMPGITS